MDRNLVFFKGNRGGIIVVLDAEADYDELRENFRRKVKDTRKFFEGSRLSVNFTGRDLRPDEEEELIQIITEASNAEIRILKKPSYELPKEKYTPKISGYEPIEPTPERREYSYEVMTIFHQGSLRSGQLIEYPGSVVIIGDINPGAEVIAEGNITVFGRIKGMVHAGCGGDRACFITGLKIEPTQLRIADIITYVPQSYIKKNRDRVNPSYAYVQDEQIYIIPLA